MFQAISKIGKNCIFQDLAEYNVQIWISPHDLRQKFHLFLFHFTWMWWDWDTPKNKDELMVVLEWLFANILSRKWVLLDFSKFFSELLMGFDFWFHRPLYYLDPHHINVFVFLSNRSRCSTCLCFLISRNFLSSKK